MSIKKLALGVAAAALIVTPALGQAILAPATAPLNGDESELEGSAIIIGVIAAAAIVGGIIILADDDDEDLPVSG